MAELNTLIVPDTMLQNQEEDLSSKVRALTSKLAMGNGVTMDMKSAVAPSELEVSKYLLANIATVDGGQTAHDVV